MDPVRARLGDLAKDLKEIKAQLLDLNSKISVYNHLLDEHTKRSTNLEDRMKPIEAWYVGVSKMYIMITAVGGLILMFAAVYKLSR